MKKIILCLVFLALGSQQAVLAGGLPRPMKDLSSDLRNELERARLNADEYKNLYLDQQAEAEKLRTDLDSINQKCNDCYRDKSQLDGAIANLRSENQELNRKVGEYKAKTDLLAVASPVVPVKIEAKPEAAKVEEDSSIFHRVFGTLIGVPVGIAAGTPIGAVRGSISKAITYADGFSEYMGPGILGEAAGNISGLGAGAIAGAFSGAAKGFTTGVKYGYLYPFTARSVSLNGSFINGYNPYDFSDLKKSNT
jgi:chorismate mutase